MHRALGPIAGSSTRFRHHAEEPLECDVLLLDEASMVDLALMRRLLDAVPAHARVIMLGDPDQLASVEAGGVLADICAAATPDGPLSASVSRLSESYRYDENSGIAALARAVHQGDIALALDVLRSGRDDVRFSASLPVPRIGRVLESEVRTHYRGFMARELEQKLRVLDDFRVLAAHRRGELGVEHLNQCIARVLRGQRARSHDNYAGRPVLITQNDYSSSLFNGDVGVLHSERRNAPLVACFRTGPESVRRVALGRLPNHESVYAMTVHKSQGSEFRHVALVLPDASSPVLTRELLYTAITRARSSLSVYGSEAALRSAIERRAERSSGLTARLRAP